MSSSIKLNNNLYWDTSGLYGGQIFNPVCNIANTSVTLTVPNAYRGLLLIFNAGNSSRSGMYMITSTSQGTVFVEAIKSAAGATVTAGTNALIVDDSYSVYIYAIGTGMIVQS